MPTEQGGFPIIYAYILIFFIFYFLVLRPQRSKQKEQKEMIKNLKKNDEVITTSGIHGTVALVKDKTVVLRVDDNVKIEFDKESILSIQKAKT
ncbi:MAG TPA: preprotein translocase subunit YajC [Candidatus Omnitrophica bacterium]|nr:MAG: preprotein translocase subunit YajC [Omnitrophica WOR_2 bacterium GWA2_45_18]HBR15488.1 preprotein translocase subunit YajC [Candidatus Omnitrophota bacterium]